MTGQIIGYSRVSSAGQKLETQIERLTAAGCEKIFKEKLSGTKMNIRDELKNALDYVRKGDVLVVTRFDRLARSARDMMNIAEQLDAKDVTLRCLDYDIDTSNPMGRAMFQMINIFSEMEAAWIAERAAIGRKRAMAAGVKFGPKEKLTTGQKKQIYVASQKDGANISAIARHHEIARPTVYKVIREIQTSLNIDPNQKFLFEDE